MRFVIDSSALIALLENETGAHVVADVVEDSGNDCYAHAVNLCEVYYHALGSHGQEMADLALGWLDELNLEQRADIDRGFWQEAARHKADLRRVSLADCFCLTLANRLEAEVVTSDHHEFDAVADRGLCAVRFIR